VNQTTGPDDKELNVCYLCGAESWGEELRRRVGWDSWLCVKLVSSGVV
jgi:hypothetical protein